MKKLLMTGLLGLIACASASAQTLINGSGATFPNPLYAKWSSAYATAVPGVQINYTGKGSSAGVADITSKTVDFGASDAPMTDAQLKAAPSTILNLPTAAGAVVVIYNVPGLTAPLKLDGPTIANLFLGKITKWNDPALAALNPGVKLPGDDVVVVHRSDGSGTTFIFTDYLSNVSADWKAGPGTNNSPKWPVGLGAEKNPGVAGQVKQTSGSIGYVELIYAKPNNIAYADVKNAAGKFVTASLDSVTAALATAKIPDDYRFSMVNAPGDASYPISGATWLLVYQQQSDPVKGKALVAFLKWVYATGEGMAPALNFAPLPADLIKKVQATVDTIKY